MKKRVLHQAHHTVFANEAPHEQLLTIIDLTGRAFNKVFAEDFIEIIESYRMEDIYNEKCVNMQKIIDEILTTKRHR